jgi:hypothetical protein
VWHFPNALIVQHPRAAVRLMTTDEYFGLHPDPREQRQQLPTHEQAQTARADQRAIRLEWLEDMFQRDRIGFDLFWLDLYDDDPELRTMLSWQCRVHADVVLKRHGRLPKESA